MSNNNIASKYDNLFFVDNTPPVKTDITIDGVFMVRKEIEELKAMYYAPVVVRCDACGQWGARRCACKSCGYPMPE